MLRVVDAGDKSLVLSQVWNIAILKKEPRDFAGLLFEFTLFFWV
jgi:hypothetical protein